MGMLGVPIYWFIIYYKLLKKQSRRKHSAVNKYLIFNELFQLIFNSFFGLLSYFLKLYERRKVQLYLWTFHIKNTNRYVGLF